MRVDVCVSLSILCYHRLVVRAALLVAGCVGVLLGCGSSNPGARLTSSAPSSPVPSTLPSQVSAPSARAGNAHATVSSNGLSYAFPDGRCSKTLDGNQFLFRDPPVLGNDLTVFTLTVTDLNGSTASMGGAHAGYLDYRKDGKDVVLGAVQLSIANDLSGGTFSGSDDVTKSSIAGSYTC